MLQIDFLMEILQKCKENGVHTAVDTAGNLPWEYFERILSCTDLFLYDVKCITETLHKEGTGVSNRLILENLRKLSQTNTEIIVRVPVISGFNGNDSEMQKIAGFIKSLGIKKVELLPYHAMGEHKWEGAGMRLTPFSAPCRESLNAYQKILIGNIKREQ